jgi:hypothetical protein
VAVVLSKHCLLLITAVFLGCSGNRHIRTYPVAGKVIFRDGKPAKGVTVKFRTSDRTPPYIAIAKADDNGVFSLNAPDGENVAVVVPFFPRDADKLTLAERERVMNSIDPSFLEYEKSPLKFAVTTDPSKNQFELRIWPPGR